MPLTLFPSGKQPSTHHRVVIVAGRPINGRSDRPTGDCAVHKNLDAPQYEAQIDAITGACVPRPARKEIFKCPPAPNPLRPRGKIHRRQQPIVQGRGRKSLTAMNELNAHSKHNLEAMVASATAATKGAEALGSQVMAFSKMAIEHNMAAAKSLSSARSVQEAVELQTAWAKSTLEAYSGRGQQGLRDRRRVGQGNPDPDQRPRHGHGRKVPSRPLRAVSRPRAPNRMESRPGALRSGPFFWAPGRGEGAIKFC